MKTEMMVAMALSLKESLLQTTRFKVAVPPKLILKYDLVRPAWSNHCYSMETLIKKLGILS